MWPTSVQGSGGSGVTLRLRVLIGLGLVAVVLVVAGVIVVRSTRADLVAKVDEQLRTVAGPRVRGGPGNGRGRALPAGDPDGPALSRSTVWVGRISGDQAQTIVAPLTADGEPASPELSGADIAFLTSHPDEAITVNGDGVKRFRVLAQPGGRGATPVVGAPLDDVDASSRRLLAVEGIATLVMLALLGLVAFWVLRLGVRPVKQMAAAAGAIVAGDLSGRVPEADPRTEAGELGTALNSMLAHIEDAFRARAASEERLRRFVADASHELRTPITTIRGYAELSRRGGLDDPADREAAMARTEQEAIRMGVLVDDLLLLARLDQGRPLLREPVDLSDIVRDAASDAAVSHPDHPVEARISLVLRGGAVGGSAGAGPAGAEGTGREAGGAGVADAPRATAMGEDEVAAGVGGAANETGADGCGVGDEAGPFSIGAESDARVGRDAQRRPAGEAAPAPARAPAPEASAGARAASGPGVVLGDDHRLRQVVGNLVANAVSHTPPGTSVVLSLVVDPADPSRLLLTVADDGAGMEPGLAARAFERFTRGDEARSRRAGSTGLGLSIVAAIVAAHSGEVALRSHPGEGTTVSVALPRAPA